MTSSSSDEVITFTPASTPSIGSPMIRHFDAVATRRNLETIVQAIDHLEQQERRNSQDHQQTDDDD